MRIGEMKDSKFIKKEDVGTGKLVTISRLEQQNVAMDNKPSEMKWVIYYREFEKGMTLNWTNLQLIAKAVGSEETNDWLGKQIVLYEDPNVSFGGELTGGIRVRAVRKKPDVPAPPMPAVTHFDDDIPF